MIIYKFIISVYLYKHTLILTIQNDVYMVGINN